MTEQQQLYIYVCVCVCVCVCVYIYIYIYIYIYNDIQTLPILIHTQGYLPSKFSKTDLSMSHSYLKICKGMVPEGRIQILQEGIQSFIPLDSITSTNFTSHYTFLWNVPSSQFCKHPQINVWIYSLSLSLPLCILSGHFWNALPLFSLQKLPFTCSDSL